MNRTIEIVPNMEEILSKQEKRDTAERYGWSFVTRNLPGEADTFIKGEERVWIFRHYIRATMVVDNNRSVSFTDHKYFKTLEEALK